MTSLPSPSWWRLEIEPSGDLEESLIWRLETLGISRVAIQFKPEQPSHRTLVAWLPIRGCRRQPERLQFRYQAQAQAMLNAPKAGEVSTERAHVGIMVIVTRGGGSGVVGDLDFLIVELYMLQGLGHRTQVAHAVINNGN